MATRITSLKESPCYQCGCESKCTERIKQNFTLGDIKKKAFGDADYDYHKCPLWIAFNAPEMVDES